MIEDKKLNQFPGEIWMSRYRNKQNITVMFMIITSSMSEKFVEKSMRTCVYARFSFMLGDDEKGYS